MSYTNADWLLIDEQIKALIDSGEDITAYLGASDRDIEIICSYNQVAPANIPVGVDGFVTSPVLIDYAIASSCVKLLRGYWGSRAGEQDIYFDKLKYWMAEQDRVKGLITKDTIGGITDSNGDPLPQDSFIQIVPMYL
jgi:hypothetical protein